MGFSFGKWVPRAIVIMDGQQTGCPPKRRIDGFQDCFGAKNGRFVVWVQQNNTYPAV